VFVSTLRLRVARRRAALTRLAVRAAKLAVIVGVTTVVLGAGAFAAASFYADYGAVRNVPNAEAWRGLSPRFAGAAACTSCHAAEAAAQDASIHRDVSCEDCHGPAAVHSTSTAAARATGLGKPASGICVNCHGVAPGRPAAFPQVDPAAHFSGGQCLRCHDPHSIVAVRPPVVTHPLVDLPECTTCHAPDGLKKIPAGHEIVDDAVCLSCHGPGADRKP
jgi:hypothetical protein